MPIQTQASDEGVLTVHVSGTLTRKDYEGFLPQVEQYIKDHGKISMLLDMQDFHGWEPEAAWEDARFSWHHSSSIERLAMVGEKRWQKLMATICRPFTRAQVRYFTHEEATAAREWLAHAPAIH